MSLLSKLQSINPQVIPDNTDVTLLMIDNIAKNNLESMGLINVSTLRRSMDNWKKHMPSVTPHYAIKCNPHPVIVKTLYELGAGFDCASPVEVQKAMAAGAKTHQIIYANPQKQSVNIRKVYEAGVNVFTFDSEMELMKMIEATPAGVKGQFILRILPPVDTHAVMNFGAKFGATKQESERLIKLAAKLQKEKNNFEIAGFSFHVGSGCTSVEGYQKCIEECGRLCQLAQSVGFAPKIVDIGGGFITAMALKHLKGHEDLPDITFEQIADVVEKTIKEVAPIFGEGFHAIAEPGRYFASDCIELITKVFGRRIMFEVEEEPEDKKEDTEESLTESDLIQHNKKIQQVKYYIGEGMYGYFNNIMFDHVLPNMKFYRGKEQIIDDARFKSNVFGPTCDSMDCVMQDQQLPLLEIGDYIVTEGFGAYTWAAATEFNGIAITELAIVIEESDTK